MFVNQNIQYYIETGQTSYLKFLFIISGFSFKISSIFLILDSLICEINSLNKFSSFSNEKSSFFFRNEWIRVLDGLFDELLFNIWY